jgi:hypothetical protein
MLLEPRLGGIPSKSKTHRDKEGEKPNDKKGQDYASQTQEQSASEPKPIHFVSPYRFTLPIDAFLSSAMVLPDHPQKTSVLSVRPCARMEHLALTNRYLIVNIPLHPTHKNRKKGFCGFCR